MTKSYPDLAGACLSLRTSLLLLSAARDLMVLARVSVARYGEIKER